MDEVESLESPRRNDQNAYFYRFNQNSPTGHLWHKLQKI